MAKKEFRLLVDDNEINRLLVTKHLAADPYEILAVSSGFEALQALSPFKPDLVLLDILMPDMDGYEVCRLMKSDPNYSSIPVIFLTALANREDAMNAFRMGGVDYIVKPYEPIELRYRVRNHLQFIKAMRENFALREEALRLRKLDALSILSAGVAHEFNNIFAGISMRVQMDRMRAKKEGASHGDFHEGALALCDRGVELVRRLLYLTREREHPRIRVDVNDLVKRVVDIIRADLLGASIKVELDAALDLPACELNIPLFTDVLLELFVNARHALEGRAEPRIAVTTRAVPAGVELQFADNGRGMDEEEVANVFSPFYTTKGALGGRVHEGKVHGTGLGLATLHKNVVDLGGSVTVESRIGRGTTFTLTLPAASAAPPPA